MRRLSDTIQRLAKAKLPLPMTPPAGGRDRLRDLEGLNANPGNLRGRVHVPDAVADRPALVVVLHGCTQTAAGYDAGSGWSRLADRRGFVVLYPEQQRDNNANLCFNWFQPEDIGRGRGEAASIRAMIDTVVRAHGIDPARIFVTGLSAGGAMASVMLATYPEVFAGGAIIAGLPFGGAASVVQALDRMRGHGTPDARALAAAVRAASDHRGAWPTVSVWHGSADATVHPSNAAAILAQWQAIHDVRDGSAEVDTVDGFQHRAWRDAAGRPAIEEYRIAGLGHGTPLDVRGSDGDEVAGPHMLDMGISSTRHIARFWGLTGTPVAARRSATTAIEPPRLVPEPARMPSPPPPLAGPAQLIEDALRAAGLMR